MIGASRVVALYLLSSPNHNPTRRVKHAEALRYIFFHHQTTTRLLVQIKVRVLRYIFFHHQTTTARQCYYSGFCCVISSFITKPQLCIPSFNCRHGCVISSFITKPQRNKSYVPSDVVALYLLSSPNHNFPKPLLSALLLRYIFFHHQTTT